MMKSKYNRFMVLIGALVFSASSCTDHLIELNKNPNGLEPSSVNPNLVLSTVLTETAKNFNNLAVYDISAGLMQHTQKDGWSSGHNDYDWGGSQDWSVYYNILRNNQFVYERAVALDYPLQQGVALVMKSLIFGMITDLWGDAPYTMALKGALEGNEYTFPVFDSQETIYTGILADLEKANTLLSKPKAEYNSSIDIPDVFYKGDPTKWRKLANSLRLRYYMRISEKKQDVAKDGIQKIVANPTEFPVMVVAADDAAMPFVGTGKSDSWPLNTDFSADGSEFRRVKMCATLVEVMRSLKDPRLGVWAAKVQIPLVVRDSLPLNTDKIVGGKRYLSPDKLTSLGISINDLNQNTDYIGIPPSIAVGQLYNLSPDANQGANNPHVSWLNSTFAKKADNLLKARIMSAAETNFILAEAAQKWSMGNAETYYKAAIKASFDTWGTSAGYAAYVAQPSVAYAGTQKQIIEQKWIASWNIATEAWFDYRRTGYPVLKSGSQAKAPVLPVRFYYMQDEKNLNRVNAEKAMDALETTVYSGFGAEVKNSPWSKPWLLRGTQKPW